MRELEFSRFTRIVILENFDQITKLNDFFFNKKKKIKIYHPDSLSLLLHGHI